MYPEISNNDIIDKQQISSNDNQVLEILQKNKLDTIKDTVDYNKKCTNVAKFMGGYHYGENFLRKSAGSYGNK